MSEKDRRYWAKLARDSALLEESDPPSPERWKRIREHVNELRGQIGLPPFGDKLEEDDPPELEFYRIARARGLLHGSRPAD